jgi:hypothetical protein
VARGESYTVIFNNNGGSGTMPDQVIDRGISMALYPNSFTPPSGYIFEGWSTNQDGSGARYTDSQVVTDLAPAGADIHHRRFGYSAALGELIHRHPLFIQHFLQGHIHHILRVIISVSRPIVKT